MQQPPTLGGGISKPLGSTLLRGMQQQTVPGVRIDVSNIKGTIRFNDLQEDLQKELERMDEAIQQQIDFHKQCDAIMPSHDHDLKCIPPSVDLLHRHLAAVEDALAVDATEISKAREMTADDAERAKLSFKVVENLKLPPQYHTPGLWSGNTTGRAKRNIGADKEPEDLIEYFSETARDLETTLSKFRKDFSEVEQHLRTLESASAHQTNLALARRTGNHTDVEDPIRELGMALVEFEASLLGVAGKVGKSRQGVQKLQLGEFLPTREESHIKSKRGGIY